MAKLISLFVLTIIFATPKPAFAHFLVRDDKTGVQASFHVTPNHEPIAGKPSAISFDFSKGTSQASQFDYQLTVKNSKRDAEVVLAQVSANLVYADYIFPAQGLYTIKLVAMPRDSTRPATQLLYSQRVDRGTPAEADTLSSLELTAIAGVLLVAAAAVGITAISDVRNKKARK